MRRSNLTLLVLALGTALLVGGVIGYSLGNYFPPVKAVPTTQAGDLYNCLEAKVRDGTLRIDVEAFIPTSDGQVIYTKGRVLDSPVNSLVMDGNLVKSPGIQTEIVFSSWDRKETLARIWVPKEALEIGGIFYSHVFSIIRAQGRITFLDWRGLKNFSCD